MLFFEAASGKLSGFLSDDIRFRSAIGYLRRCMSAASDDASRIDGMQPGQVFKMPLEEGSVAMEQAYLSKARSDCFFESHRLYIDVQCVLAGEETIDVIPAAGLEVAKPYRPEKDVVKYKDPGPGRRLRLGPGCIAVFFPEDGHMPGQWIDGPVLVRKTVIKVPVTPGIGLQ
jgi:YhcH/YjgK/YiaL family protein